MLSPYKKQLSNGICTYGLNQTFDVHSKKNSQLYFTPYKKRWHTRIFALLKISLLLFVFTSIVQTFKALKSFKFSTNHNLPMKTNRAYSTFLLSREHQLSFAIYSWFLSHSNYIFSYPLQNGDRGTYVCILPHYLFLLDLVYSSSHQ